MARWHPQVRPGNFHQVLTSLEGRMDGCLHQWRPYGRGSGRHPIMVAPGDRAVEMRPEDRHDVRDGGRLLGFGHDHDALAHDFPQLLDVLDRLNE